MAERETGWQYFHAPGRVNLIGDHTDYAEGLCLPMAIDRECVVGYRREIPLSNLDYAEGLVLPMAIDSECVVTCRVSGGGSLRARSRELEGEVVIALDDTVDARAVEPRWGSFVAGTLEALRDRGAVVPPAELSVSSSVPSGSGLSSSSALSVALVLALADAAGAHLDRTEAARTALDAEVRATGVPGGLMDQLAALHGVAGHALVIDCRHLRAEPISLPGELAVLVAHSGLPRTLAATAYAERRASTDAAAAALGLPALRDATLAQVRDDPRARHVVTENARVVDFARALRRGDLAALGRLMLASHASLRDDFEVSTPELDALVDAFVEAGALGARLTGAGFGGCVVALTTLPRAEAVMTGAATGYRARTNIATSPFAVRAADGAGRLARP